MCGIAVLLAKPGCFVSIDLVQQFDSALAHRGPDAAGFAGFDRNAEACAVQGAAVALVHRRLSIIDLDPRSNQPMNSVDGRFVLIFNGEIYNYIELRAELVRAGHQFRTESDSEVLLAAYAAWGEKALLRLTGMFSFAILDRRQRVLFVARDPFGIKPLYWAMGRDALAFASEIGPLLEVPGVGRAVDASRLSLYMSAGQTDSGAATMFAGVRCLPAGCFALISLDNPAPPQPIRYWAPRIDPRERPVSVSVRDLRETFLESIRLHLRSDVPIGIALSGGIDSSAILACAREIGGASLKISTFSFAAEGSDLDESPFADIASTAAGAEAHRVRVGPDEIIADIDRLIKSQAEPFGSLSIYAQFRVMQLAAANGIKVMLDGQGADELFAGYRPYLARRLSELMATGQLGQAFRLIGRMRHLPGVGAALFAQAFEPMVPRGLRVKLRRLVGRPSLPPWIDARWLSSHDGLEYGPELHFQPHFLHAALAQSLTGTVLPALLRYEDRNSMTFSIESRVPFLTPALAELAYSLPSNQLIDDNGTSKYVLREAMRGIVSDSILDRRDKVGFATPDRLWAGALHPWFMRVLSSDAARAVPWLKADQAVRVLQRRMDGSHGFGADIWRTINVVRWIEAFDLRIA